MDGQSNKHKGIIEIHNWIIKWIFSWMNTMDSAFPISDFIWCKGSLIG